MARFEVVESRVWKHAETGRTVSIYGSPPHGNGWEIVSQGWTVRDNREGTVGLGRRPDKAREDAQARADHLNSMTKGAA